MAEEKLKEGLVECICGNWYPEDECVELYDGLGNMVANGKLSTPLKKNFSSEATIKTKLTF